MLLWPRPPGVLCPDDVINIIPPVPAPQITVTSLGCHLGDLTGPSLPSPPLQGNLRSLENKLRAASAKQADAEASAAEARAAQAAAEQQLASMQQEYKAMLAEVERVKAAAAQVSSSAGAAKDSKVQTPDGAEVGSLADMVKLLEAKEAALAAAQEELSAAQALAAEREAQIKGVWRGW